MEELDQLVDSYESGAATGLCSEVGFEATDVVRSPADLSRLMDAVDRSAEPPSDGGERAADTIMRDAAPGSPACPDAPAFSGTVVERNLAPEAAPVPPPEKKVSRFKSERQGRR